MGNSNEVKVLAVSGSLRKGSFNTATLRAVVEMAPKGMAIATYDLAPIPLYNEDVRAHGFPPPVQDFRDRIQEADAVLFVTPEYNYSIPGVLKNAIDWASRPPAQPFNGKPIGIIGASPSLLGTARCQYHLRQCFVFLNSIVMNQPEVMIARANEKFDESGRLTDESTAQHLQKYLQSFMSFVRLHRQEQKGAA